MNTTEEYWEIDGVSLNTWAWNIATLEGRESIPPKRGSNQIVAYRPGEVWRPKVFGAKPLSLAMWVKGSDEDGAIPAEGGRAQFRSNLDQLKMMFAVTDRELVLTRRVRTLASLLVQQAKAEVTGTLEPSMKGRTAAAFVVDMLMADPFWYGDETTVVVPTAGVTIVYDGSAPAYKMTIKLNGPLTNPQLVNQSPDVPIAVTYNGTIAAGDFITLDTDNFAATDQDDVSVIGAVTHSGDRSWMKLFPGANAMLLNPSAGTGTAEVTYAPSYL